MARLFIMHVYWWTGPLDTIVSDWGPQFISDFWNEFCQILGVKLRLSTANHAQTDGQTEIINQHMAQRLRPFVNHYQDDWSDWLLIMDFAAAVLPHESTGVPPFLINQGVTPQTSFDWQQPQLPDQSAMECLNRNDAQKWVQRLEATWNYARKLIEKAQDSQQQQADRHRRVVDFKVGDMVWVSACTWKTDCPSRKLDYQMAGPYCIVEQIGNAYKLDLPASIHVHPVFSPDKLWKAATDPLPGQIEDPPPAIEVNGEYEWEVEEILAVCLHWGKLQYKVKWVGYDNDPTWYPAANFIGSPHRL